VAGRATVSFVTWPSLSHRGSPAAPLRLVLAALVALVSFQARLVWLSRRIGSSGTLGILQMRWSVRTDGRGRRLLKEKEKSGVDTK
jgi:hypothetical protein